MKRHTSLVAMLLFQMRASVAARSLRLSSDHFPQLNPNPTDNRLAFRSSSAAAKSLFKTQSRIPSCYEPTRTQMYSSNYNNRIASHYLPYRSHNAIQTAIYSSPSDASSSGIPNWELITNHQTSKTVKLFKSIHKANKSKRSELGLTVAEGVRLVADILSNEESRRLVRRILVSESLLYNDSGADLEIQQQLRHWLRVAHDESVQRKKEHDQSDKKEINNLCSINIGTDQVVTACSGTVTTQGVVALMEIPEPYNPSDSNNIAPFYLVLDGLSDPGNVGTLLRSCAASDVTALLLLPDSCDVWNPKAVRSAMGASFRVPVLEISDKICSSHDESGINAFDKLLDFLEKCGVQNYRVYAATMEDSGDKETSKQSLPHYKIDWIGHDKSGGAALILGREGDGLRKDVRNAIQDGRISTVHVPMAPGTESLNAAVCGSVMMFERMRQMLVLQEEGTSLSP
jgi:tRNA G18 (ribose-2'-O)-methylase SpoU